MNYRRKIVVGLVAGAALVLLVFVAPLSVQVVVFCLLGIGMFYELGWQAVHRARRTATWLFVAVLAAFIVLGIHGAIRLLESHWGGVRLFVVACVVIATDVGAQLFGQRFGKPGTFFPRLSPNKTLHGVVGGIALGLCLALVAIPWLITFDRDAKWLLLALVPFMAVLGDLLESATKRSLGIKDFAKYIPQTGGVLDRIDSWLPALVLAGWTLV